MIIYMYIYIYIYVYGLAGSSILESPTHHFRHDFPKWAIVEKLPKAQELFIHIGPLTKRFTLLIEVLIVLIVLIVMLYHMHYESHYESLSHHKNDIYIH